MFSGSIERDHVIIGFPQGSTFLSKSYSFFVFHSCLSDFANEHILYN